MAGHVRYRAVAEISLIKHIGIVLGTDGIQGGVNDCGKIVSLVYLQMYHNYLIPFGIYGVIKDLLTIFVGERVAQHSRYFAQGDRIKIGNLGQHRIEQVQTDLGGLRVIGSIGPADDLDYGNRAAAVLNGTQDDLIGSGRLSGNIPVGLEHDQLDEQVTVGGDIDAAVS